MVEPLDLAGAAPRETPSVDPGWKRYRVWPWNYFPFNFPSCHLTRTQTSLSEPEVARLRWRMSLDLPLLARVDDHQGRILTELEPRANKGGAETAFEVVHEFREPQLEGDLSLAFTWVFYAPMIPYVPHYPMGYVQAPKAELLGRETLIEITDTRPPKTFE